MTDHPLKGKQVFTRSAAPLFAKVSTALLGLYLNYLATQYLPLTEYGLFTLAQLVVLMLTTFSKLGLDVTLVRFTARLAHKNQGKDATSALYSAYLISLCCWVLSAGLLWLQKDWVASSLFSAPALSGVMASILLISLVNVGITLHAGVLRGCGQATVSSLFSGGVSALLATVGFILFPPQQASEALTLVLLSHGLALILSGVLLRYTTSLLAIITRPFGQLTAVFTVTRALWLVSIVTLMNQQFASALLVSYVDIEVFGVFSLAAKLALAIGFINFAVNAVISPFYARMSETPGPQLRQLHRKVNTVMLGVALALSLGIYGLAAPMLALFGQAFTAATPYFLIMAGAQMINIATGTCVSVLTMTGHENLHARITLVTFGIATFASMTLVPVYGAMGAAIATATSISLQNLISFWFAQRAINQSISSARHHL